MERKFYQVMQQSFPMSSCVLKTMGKKVFIVKMEGEL